MSIFPAPIALADIAHRMPIGPAPNIAMLFPTLMPARLHACSAMASGCTAAPSSMLRLSGILGMGNVVRDKLKGTYGRKLILRIIYGVFALCMLCMDGMYGVLSSVGITYLEFKIKNTYLRVWYLGGPQRRLTNMNHFKSQLILALFIWLFAEHCRYSGELLLFSILVSE